MYRMGKESWGSLETGKLANNHLLEIEPIKKISVFWVSGLKIISRVGTHIFFSGKKYNVMHFERHLPFKMHKIIFFSPEPKAQTSLRIRAV